MKKSNAKGDKVRIAQRLLNPKQSFAMDPEVINWLKVQGVQVPANREMQLQLALSLLECNDFDPESKVAEAQSRRRRKGADAEI